MLPPLGERGGTIAISDLLGMITLTFCFFLILSQRIRLSFAHAALLVHVSICLLSCIFFLGDSFFSQSLGRAVRFICIISPALMFLFFDLSRDKIVVLVNVYLWTSAIGIALPLIAYGLGYSSAFATQTIDLEVSSVVQRAGGWVGDSSAFGHQISSLASLFIFGFFYGMIKSRFLSLLVLAVTSYGLYATSSRSAFLSIVVSLILYYIVSRESFFEKFWKLSRLVLLVATLFFFVYYFDLLSFFSGTNIIWERLIAPIQLLFSGDSVTSVSSGRTENWGRMFDVLGWRLLIGVGYGSLAILYGIADNIFIKSLGETGLGGILSLVSFFMLLLIKFWKKRTIPVFSFGLFFLISQLISSLLVDTFTFYSSIPPVILVLFAVYCHRQKN